MFDHLEPDTSDDQGSPGTGSLPLPPRSGANIKGTRSLNPEKVRHMLYGSLAAIDRTIKILHALGYADPNDWSDPIPAPPTSPEPGQPGEPQTWMAILTKTVLIE
ncbi:hypothetical protein IQ254_06540 [Nodosilinea sp. LEGE 07088]|uniref:hypothetical protein n=1 Tax=Nodosilinea sp. LEGE 07088 TaxID=2777968 RepID=UPI001882A457|nr:hypothetical protein [Nodosilinea sp. LEGE 07088]MBE9136864.1 hypothetical protein [Nodosilinea sp. LEGE 07088]